jgi:hypothetical protein
MLGEQKPQAGVLGALTAAISAIGTPDHLDV